MITWLKTKIAERVLAQADSMRELRKFSRAEVLYGKAIKLLSTALTKRKYVAALGVAGQAYLGLGRTHLILEQPELALDEFRLAYEIIPLSWKPLYYRGCAEARLGDYSKAEKSFSAALAKNGTEPRIYIQRGHARFKAGLLDEALDDYLEAQRRKALQENDRLTLASLYLHCAQFSQAEQLLRPLVNKHHPEACLWLGVALERQEKWREALTFYTQVAGIPKIEVEVYARLGIVHARLRQYEAAAASLKYAIGKKFETDSVLFYYGWVCYQLERFETCLSAWEQLRKRHPGNQRLRASIYKTLYAWGCERARAGDYDSAIRLWTENYSGRENDEQLARGLAELHLYSTWQEFQQIDFEGFDQAEEHLAEAYELAPNDTRFPFYLSMIAMLNADFDRARQLLQAAVTLNPDDPRLKYYWSLFVREDGDEVEAATTLEALATENRDSSWTHRAAESLAAIYVEQERWSDAADTLLYMTRPHV